MILSKWGDIVRVTLATSIYFANHEVNLIIGLDC